MGNDAADPIRNPPRAVVFCNETFHYDPSSERLPGQPDDFTGNTKIVECTDPGFRVRPGKGAVEGDFAVVWSKTLQDSRAAGETVDR